MEIFKTLNALQECFNVSTLYGFSIFQEIRKRFGKIYEVEFWFAKAINNIQSLIDRNDSASSEKEKYNYDGNDYFWAQGNNQLPYLR